MGKNMEAKQQEKLTYDQVKDIASNLQTQLQTLQKEYNRLMVEYNRAMEVVMGKRIDSLFSVLKYKELFNEDFVSDAINSIEDMLTIKEAEPENYSCEPCCDDQKAVE